MLPSFLPLICSLVFDLYIHSNAPYLNGAKSLDIFQYQMQCKEIRELLTAIQQNAHGGKKHVTRLILILVSLCELFLIFHSKISV